MSLLTLTPVVLPEGLDRLRSDVRGFLADTDFACETDSWIRSYDPAFSRKLGERGWLGITWPKRYGGGAGSAFERFVVNEELLAAGAPVAAHWIADRQVGPSLLRNGTEEQRLAYLPGIARGELFFAVGFSEPDAGSDVASVRTTAKPVDGGWRLNGRKVWTSGAHLAHAMIVLARTTPRRADRHAGLSQLIVDLPAPGVQINPILGMDGFHHFNEVILDDVFVPHNRMLGAPGDGWAQATAELAFERSGAERFLSFLPLLDAYATKSGGADQGLVSRAVARARILRTASLSVTALLDQDESPDLEAAVVKDLGTTFEQDMVNNIRQATDSAPLPDSDDPLGSHLAAALIRMPTVTLRGGSSDVLRGVLARQLGLR